MHMYWQISSQQFKQAHIAELNKRGLYVAKKKIYQRFLILFFDKYCLVWPWLHFSDLRSIWAEKKKKCRQSNRELQLGLLVRGWKFSQQLKLCNQTHTYTHTSKRKTNPLPLYCKKKKNDPEFEALLYLRLLHFLPRLTQGLINKKKQASGTRGTIELPNHLNEIKARRWKKIYHTDVQ